MTSSALLICPACGSMDIEKENVTIDGVTEEWYVCNDCFFEWPVVASTMNASSSDEGQ
ncbi:hypothetical protein V2A85_12715 [Yersinia sp. 1252 StPb PI]|uniref:hypothetical protein n=1 Tax=Yersinia sp. 1252 StPb PI TaxID=3117404 RepID=UPI003B28432B